MKSLTIFFVSLLSVITASAYAPHMSFKKIGIPQGLPHATVNSMACDNEGMLWIATPDGISRFDSYSFKNYHPSSGRKHVRPGIKHVAAEGGRIYASGATIMYRYNADSDNFDSFEMPDRSSTIRTFAVTSDTTIVIGTGRGVCLFNPQNGAFRHIIPELTEPVNALVQLGDTLYAGLGSLGVARITADGLAGYLPLPPNTDVNTLLADGRKLLVGTEGQGIYIYSPGNGSLARHGVMPPDSHVRALAFDNGKNLWAGTFDGLYIISPDRENIHKVPAGDDGISHSSVRAICPDRQGGIWLGTFFGGLNYYNPLNNQISSLRKGNTAGKSLNDNIVSVMTEDSRQRIWIGTNNGGVNIFDPADNSFRYFTSADGLGSNDVKAIHIDETSGKAYIGTHIGAMTILDINSGKMHSANIPSRNVFAIEPSLDGRLWLNAFNCLFIYDPRTGAVSDRVEIFCGKRQLLRSTGLYRDAEKRLWVFGEDGATVFTEKNGQLKQVRFFPDSISDSMVGIEDVFQDTERRIWLATDNGLRAFSASGKELWHFTGNDGLPSHIINAVSEDAAGKIWVSTNHGIARINGDNGHIDNFSSRDSFGNSRFSVKSVLNTSSGKMMFGGIDGIRIFNPSVLETNPYSPTPRITGLRLFNKEVTPGDDTGLLDRSIGTTDRLTFNSDQTSFTIEFSVCNFPSAGENTFYYMLDGLDRQWIPLAAGSRSVTYSNLPPGSYRFMLKAANCDGLMSEHSASIGIRILPVWYLSWWAVLLWTVLLLGALGFVLRIIWHRKMLAAKMDMQKADFERQQKTEEMKIRFFINLSHELRTPLTLMMLPVDELLARKNDAVTTEKLNTVKNNTLRILHIVNQLLDYRRAEMGMFRLKVHDTDINMLARRIFASYDSMARHKNIRYTFDSTVGDNALALDRDYIELILNNLISNAFKYTPDGQSISLQLSFDGSVLHMAVKDSGCGIPADKLEKIFTRFYQINDAGSGNGIGLSLVKRLVELHHGNISVSSRLGEGSEFIVSLPATSSAYSNDERAEENTADSAGTHCDVRPFIRIPDSSPEIESGPVNDNTDNNSSRPTVMVVDDNSEILKYIGDTLKHSYNVVLAANGAKAIEQLTSEKIDLILTDVMMPDVDGVQLCRAVKRNLRTSHIPVIMLSAKSDIADQMDGMDVGADDYIPKPFSLELLKAKIRNQLRTRSRLIDLYSSSTEIEPAKVAMNPLDEEFLNKAINVMDKHLDDSQFSTDAFAREMFMSRSNLHLKMKALTGDSTNEFIRRVRMNKALELLRSARYTVSEVSAMVGYSTPSYFATSFKKFFGYSPSDLVKKD